MTEISNRVLLDEIQGIKRDQKSRDKIQAGINKDHDVRIRKVENFQIAYEAAAKALEGARPQRGTTISSDFINVVIKFITLLTAFVALIYGLLQIALSRIN